MWIKPGGHLRVGLNLTLFVFLFSALNCSPADSTDPCSRCGEGQICHDWRCVDIDRDADTDHDAEPDSDPEEDTEPDVETDSICPTIQCGDTCCRADEFCAYDTACAIIQDPCVSSDDCNYDSYCDEGTCIPYGIPEGRDYDEDCENPINIEAILPAVQCRWTGPPDGDPDPLHHHVMSTPAVVDFDFDNDPDTLEPSIVFTSFPTDGYYHGPGVLRVISGSDCAQQHTFSNTDDVTMSPSGVAVGDLDGDGRAEIVAPSHSGGLLAFRYDPDSGRFDRYWRSGPCSGGGPPTSPDYTGGLDQWSGPSIHDLDDDGVPEIIYGATVYRSDGCIVSSSLGFPSYHHGLVPVIVDVDNDGEVELVHGSGIYAWSIDLEDWVAEPYFSASGLPHGQVAVADMGIFPLSSMGGGDRAEVVVISLGQIRVQTIEGTVIFGPLEIPGEGRGGAPTIADFDGDGRREFASAGGSNYVVFDFDCLPDGRPEGCDGEVNGTGILWTQPSQDESSNTTGSSVFDFDANGAAEAVYADECFLRIYNGINGDVLYSAARSSGTTYENPVIVDADGDFRTEIVSAVNNYAGDLDCPPNDPLMPESLYEQNHGIVVLRDIEDRWAASRPVWNQHAYSVTHVGDHGEIPRTSTVDTNWTDPTLNNFRQNVQGDLDALGEPDLTSGGDVGAVECEGTVATISARVCNRGTLPMVSGTEVAFYHDDLSGTELCRTSILIALSVGECTEVSCEADLEGQTIDVFVMVDPDSETTECYERNNGALYRGVSCGAVPY